MGRPMCNGMASGQEKFWIDDILKLRDESVLPFLTLLISLTLSDFDLHEMDDMTMPESWRRSLALLSTHVERSSFNTSQPSGI